ncbi:MAG: TlpA disulfide reductase family protein [Chromatiaceae bacterium]
MPIPSRPLTRSLLNRRRFLATTTGLTLAVLSPFVWSLTKGLTPLETPIPAPDLRLQDLQGKTIDLAQYRGRVVLINFWATWCPPCRKEFPSLGRVRQLFKPEEFEVLAVNVDEDRETALAFAGAPGFPVLLDSNSKATMTWPVKGLPTSFIVDTQGRIAFSLAGEQEFDGPEMVTVIRSLLQP